MSPPVSPEEPRAGPIIQSRQRVQPASNRITRTGVPLFTWTPGQVAEWMHVTGFEKSIIEQFFINDISGSTLIDLKYEDLKELGITSFGHRHRLWNEIRSLKERHLINRPLTPPEEQCYTPSPTLEQTHPESTTKKCSSPDTPEENQYIRLPTSGIRHGRRRRHSNDLISPAESASIVAIEQLLPKPHKCSKGANCSKWQKQQRKLARIATEFPLEIQQINAAAQVSPVESGLGAHSTIVPSVIASSDLLGPGQVPPVRLEENALRVFQSRDPQENVRQFLSFQHMNGPTQLSPETPPYEMFPPLSPPTTQAPHQNLRSLPKLTIPTEPSEGTFSPDRTAVPFKRGTPLTAVDMRDRQSYQNIYRLDSPASDMDVPVTTIPMGPIERDVSSSVPPDMRFGGNEPIQRSTSRAEYRRHRPDFLNNNHHQNQTFSPVQHSTSTVGHRRQPSFAMATLTEYQSVSEAQPVAPMQGTAPTVEDVNHAGWMKKRKTKMLRHEWQDNHFRLNGTRLAMHKDDKAKNVLEYIDVDEYAVACSSINSGKLNSAFKRLQLSGKKKEGDATAYAFQLVPAAEKKGILNAATGKTHHFAVKTGSERIDWMRELMLAKALKKQKGNEVGHSSFE